MTENISLNIHGVSIAVRSSSKDVADWLRFDFSFFLSEENPAPLIKIDLEIGPVPGSLIPTLVETMHSPKFVCYDDGSKRYVDYYGRAVAVHDYQTESAQVYSADPAFAYEKVYLLILSRCGEALDNKGLHRVHSLGLAFDGRAALFLIPERGGKSTLGLSMLGRPRVKMMSDDSPLIDRTGHVLPFPLRIGVRAGEAPKEIPAEFVRTFSREEGGEKSLIKMTYYESMIEDRKLPAGWIFVGKWIYADEPRIEKAGKLAGFFALMRDCVFGLGLAQVVEFFLRSNSKDVFRKTGLVFRRMRAVIALLVKADTYHFYLSRNREKNRECLLNFLGRV